MFKGNSSVSFKCSKVEADVIKVVEEQLSNMGNVSVSSSGSINVTGSKFSGFGYETSIEGRVNNRDGYFSVDIEFEARPATAGWLIAICFFPLGLAVMILPNNAKGDMQRKAEQALQEIKFVLAEK
jgi:hypothetical protein